MGVEQDIIPSRNRAPGAYRAPQEELFHVIKELTHAWSGVTFRNAPGPGREGTSGGHTSSTCATLGSLWRCYCDLHTYGRPPEPAKVAPGEAHTRAAPVEMCQMARFRPSAARASHALPSAAYAAEKVCRARIVTGRPIPTP